MKTLNLPYLPFQHAVNKFASGVVQPHSSTAYHNQPVAFPVMSSYKYVCSILGKQVADWVKRNSSPTNRSVCIVSLIEPAKKVFTVVQKNIHHLVLSTPLNSVKEINNFLYHANTHLSSDKGLLTCYFESKSTRSERIAKSYRLPFRWLVVMYDFIVCRFLPSILPEGLVNYSSTYTILPKTEVLGRLYYMGFSVVETKKMNGLTYVLAIKQRHLEMIPPEQVYGPLIKLCRIGKQGIRISVFKIRTMYAYSEFLQEYMYLTHQLQGGGKIKNDIRICSWGRFLRTYFLDELPMLWNVVKGEMKLVGVRPLSPHYMSLYSEEVRSLRTQFTPGLLPPFYADLPGTLDEIQQSELRYLQACMTKGILITDIHYFFKIIRNLLFNHAKSA